MDNQTKKLIQDAVSLKGEGKHAEAKEIYIKLLKILPNHPAIFEDLGDISFKEFDYINATHLYNRSLELQKNQTNIFYKLGLCQTHLKNLQEAKVCYDKAIILKPDFIAAIYNRANIHFDLNLFKEAIEDFDQFLNHKSDYADAYLNRGLAYWHLGELERALSDYDKAIVINPSSAEALNNKAHTLKDMGRFDDAIKFYEQSIEVNQNYVDALSNLGVLYYQLKNYDKALHSYEAALQINPQYPNAYRNKSHLKLLCGDFEEGWSLHEWRWKVDPMKNSLRHYDSPLWLGKESINGKVIYVYYEQGLGDTIQFCRYIPMLESLGAEVIFETQKELLELMGSLSSTIKIVDQYQDSLKFDYHCPLMSLPLAFRTTLKNIPSKPYIRAKKEKVILWAERLGKKERMRVGLVWSGGARENQAHTYAAHKRRNIELLKLKPLRSVLDMSFFSLQKGKLAENELEDLIKKNWDGPIINNFTSELIDFSDTAALIMNLDLIISVDTSTAHLAAAMGKSVWLLNRYDTCWRWLDDGRTDSPWYPSIRLFRQPKPNDWESVINEVCVELKKLTGSNLS